MREELLVDVELGSLAYVIESHFSISEQVFHEIGFYYGMELPETFPFAPNEICHRIRDGEAELEFKWLPATNAVLSAHDFGPESLRDRLNELPAQTLHLTEETYRWGNFIPPRATRRNR